MNQNLAHKVILSSISCVQDKKNAIGFLVRNGYKSPKELVFKLCKILCNCSFDAKVISDTLDEEISKIEILDGKKRVIVSVNRCVDYSYAISIQNKFLPKVQDAIEKRIEMFSNSLD